MKPMNVKETESAINDSNGIELPDSIFSPDDSEEVDDGYLEPTEKEFFLLPMLDELGRKPYHMIALKGVFKVKALTNAYRAKLVRSEALLSPNGKPVMARMLFALGDGVYGHFQSNILCVFAPTAAMAAKAALEFRQFVKLPGPKKPGFYLLRTDGYEPHSEFVPVGRPIKLNDEDLALHYGPGFTNWELNWLETMNQRQSGVSVFYGPPGCGKTTYMRALMGKLLDRFVFYYLPISAFDLLGSPQFVGYWLKQAERHGDKQKVAILEDAEALLAPRDEGSREQVSNLLNIGDGFLGDHLKLHIIATTNVPIRELDPAVTRPGRLMGAREFPRLSREAALRLAETKGIHGLPEQPDYSLAEIYCHAPNSCHLPHARRCGFA